jgi:hypothetical protein
VVRAAGCGRALGLRIIGLTELVERDLFPGNYMDTAASSASVCVALRPTFHNRMPYR